MYKACSYSFIFTITLLMRRHDLPSHCMYFTNYRNHIGLLIKSNIELEDVIMWRYVCVRMEYMIMNYNYTILQVFRLHTVYTFGLV